MLSHQEHLFFGWLKRCARALLANQDNDCSLTFLEQCAGTVLASPFNSGPQICSHFTQLPTLTCQRHELLNINIRNRFVNTLWRQKTESKVLSIARNKINPGVPFHGQLELNFYRQWKSSLCLQRWDECNRVDKVGIVDESLLRSLERFSKKERFENFWSAI